MANSGKFKKGASASKNNMKKAQNGTKPPFPGAKSKAQGGTPQKISKPEANGKGKLKGAMSKGKGWASRGAKLKK